MPQIREANETQPDIIEPANPGNYDGQYWTIYEAWKKTGINKGTLSRDIRLGKLQLHDREDGKRKLFAPAVLGFYGDRLRKRDAVAATMPQASETNETHPSDKAMQMRLQLIELQAELRFTQTLLKEKERQTTGLEQDRDRWHKAYEELKMLPAPAPQPAASNAPEPSPKRGLWDKIIGR